MPDSRDIRLDMKILLPDRSHVQMTGKTDPVCRHYQPIVRYFMNKRLEGALKLLANTRCVRLLDIGYGGGIFFPELSRLSDELYGVDIHGGSGKVDEMLKKEKIKATLLRGDVTSLPFQDGYFDIAVCISVLEFVKDLDKAFGEIARVLKPGGTAIIGFPVLNLITDAAFLIIGINPKGVHASDHKDIIAAAKRHFSMDKMLTFPANLPLEFSMFAHCRLRKG